jgi:collagenase-like PrtC family protease
MRASSSQKLLSNATGHPATHNGRVCQPDRTVIEREGRICPPQQRHPLSATDESVRGDRAVCERDRPACRRRQTPLFSETDFRLGARSA